MTKSARDFLKPGLEISNIKIMGIPRFLDDIESISTMKKTNQTLQHYDFLKQNYRISERKISSGEICDICI